MSQLNIIVSLEKGFNRDTKLGEFFVSHFIRNMHVYMYYVGPQLSQIGQKTIYTRIWRIKFESRLLNVALVLLGANSPTLWLKSLLIVISY